MLVDVVRLRSEGVKRPREAVLVAAPVRGILTLTEPPTRLGQAAKESAPVG